MPKRRPAGAQLTFDYSEGLFVLVRPLGISAVFVEQLNAFEVQYHANTDDWVSSIIGMMVRKQCLMIGWEGHDEGDMSPKAATSSLSWFRRVSLG